MDFKRLYSTVSQVASIAMRLDEMAQEYDSVNHTNHSNHNNHNNNINKKKKVTVQDSTWNQNPPKQSLSLIQHPNDNQEMYDSSSSSDEESQSDLIMKLISQEKEISFQDSKKKKKKKKAHHQQQQEQEEQHHQQQPINPQEWNQDSFSTMTTTRTIPSDMEMTCPKKDPNRFMTDMEQLLLNSKSQPESNTLFSVPLCTDIENPPPKPPLEWVQDFSPNLSFLRPQTQAQQQEEEEETKDSKIPLQRTNVSWTTNWRNTFFHVSTIPTQKLQQVLLQGQKHSLWMDFGGTGGDTNATWTRLKRRPDPTIHTTTTTTTTTMNNTSAQDETEKDLQPVLLSSHTLQLGKEETEELLRFQTRNTGQMVPIFDSILNFLLRHVRCTWMTSMILLGIFFLVWFFTFPNRILPISTEKT